MPFLHPPPSALPRATITTPPPTVAAGDIQAIVVNASAERRASMAAHLAERCPQLPVVWLAAATPANSGDYMSLPPKSTVRLSVQCCTRSHAWAVAAAGAPTAPRFSVIFEDDVRVHPRFVAALDAVAAAWPVYAAQGVRMVSLGYVPTARDPRAAYVDAPVAHTLPVAGGIVLRRGHTLGLQAYVVAREDAAAAAVLLCQPTEEAVRLALLEATRHPILRETDMLAPDQAVPFAFGLGRQLAAFPMLAREDDGAVSIVGNANQSRYYPPYNALVREVRPNFEDEV